MRENLSVLMVGHDKDTEEYIKILLNRKFPFLDFKTTRNGLEAIDLCNKQNFDLIFTELFILGMNGISAIEKIRSNDSNVQIILYTSRLVEIENNIDLKNKVVINHTDILYKPSSIMEIDSIIDNIKSKLVV